MYTTCCICILRPTCKNMRIFYYYSYKKSIIMAYMNDDNIRRSIFLYSDEQHIQLYYSATTMLVTLLIKARDGQALLLITVRKKSTLSAGAAAQLLGTGHPTPSSNIKTSRQLLPQLQVYIFPVLIKNGSIATYLQ